MSAFNSFTVNDRETTPVAHTFSPQSKGPGDIVLFEEQQSSPAGARKCTVSWRKTAGRRRVRIVFADPKEVTETINGVAVPKVVHTNFADVTFTFDEDSTLQERKNLVGMFANALGSSVTVIDNTVTGLEGIW